jgi:pimeloyl-ACP methyl ester carboxylesterase
LPAGQVEGTTVECGYLVVPEKRTDPDAGTIRLAVGIFHPPGGATEPDPIIYLAGGPGGSALELLHLSFERVYEPMMAAGRDLILFDQRGVGLSEPALDCPDATELALELLDHERDGEELSREEMDVLFGDAYMACAQDLRAVADLTTYNTANSAADVNDLRLALGYDQVNLWGQSYGTRLALGVMRDYPQGVRSVVLDSVYPPDVDMYLESPANLDRALEVLFEACAADAACSAAYPDLRQVFFNTAEHLNSNPVETVIRDPFTGQIHNALLTGDVFFGLVFQLLYQTEVLPVLPQLITDVSQGDVETLNRIRGAVLGQGLAMSRGMSLSVQCNEETAFSTVEEFDAVLVDYPELADFFEGATLGHAAHEVCTFWGAGQAADIENEPVTSDIRTLVMTGEFDPITPPAWGRQAADTLENSFFYLYPNVGHGAASVAGCPQDMLLAFLNDPSQPPDDTCIAEMGLQFAVPTAREQTVEFEPFTNEEMGIRGLAPVGWTEAMPGAYTRSDSALDSTALIMQTAPGRIQDWLVGFSGRSGLETAPASSGEREANDLVWALYAVQLQGLSVDIALAESGRSVLIVLLQSTPDERDELFDTVFLPAVDALVPIE